MLPYFLICICGQILPLERFQEAFCRGAVIRVDHGARVAASSVTFPYDCATEAAVNVIINVFPLEAALYRKVYTPTLVPDELFRDESV